MGTCVVDECEEQTSRSDFKLCREHWTADRDGLLNNCKECDALMDSDKPLCGPCYQADNKPRAPNRAGPVGPGLSATQLGEEIGLKANKVNRLFQELGWIEQTFEGWAPTPLGEREGARLKEHSQSGGAYVVWPRAVLQNRFFKLMLPAFLDASDQASTATLLQSAPPQVLETIAPLPARRDSTQLLSVAAREKFDAPIRTSDGHFVRSRGEALIDNWLYQAKLVHAYEKRLPIEEGDVLSDFFLPEGSTVYIEYWGLQGEHNYDARKQEKQRLYAAGGFPLIELSDEHINNLDDYLPKFLLKHKIKAR